MVVVAVAVVYDVVVMVVVVTVVVDVVLFVSVVVVDVQETLHRPGQESTTDWPNSLSAQSVSLNC